MTDVTTVFGLTKKQLRPIIQNAVNQPIVSFHITVDHQVQGFIGYSADKIIPTFIYATEFESVGRITIFAKRFHRTGPAEAHHYVNLQKYNAPIPRIYGFMEDPVGREILFLEYLDAIGDVKDSHNFLDDLGNFQSCIEAVAHFNALNLSEVHAAQLPLKNVRKVLEDACITLESIWNHALCGDLGEALGKLCSNSQGKLSQLQAFAIELINPIARMGTGLIHGDIYPENTGWRPDTRELLILDLEWIGFGPRFWDVAMLLGAPNEIQSQSQHRDELAQYYLEKYFYWGGNAPSLSQFLEEISVLWMAQKLSMMWFGLNRALDGHADWTDNQEEVRQFFQNELYNELKVFLTSLF